MVFWILSNLFLYVWFLTVVSPASIPNGCPRHIGMSQLLKYGPYCIQIRTHAGDWQQARRQCQFHKGDLVQVEDQKMQEAIENKLKAMSTELTGYWIGGKSSIIDGSWQWLSGEQITGYSNWAPGQGPGHHTNFMFENSCAAIFPDPQFQWHDYDCSRRLAAFICQYNIDTKTTPRTPHSSTNSQVTFGAASTETTNQTTSTPFTTTTATTRQTTTATTHIPTTSTVLTTSTSPSTTTTPTEIPTTTIITTEIPTTTTTTTTTTVPTTTTERTTRTTTTEEIYGVIIGR